MHADTFHSTAKTHRRHARNRHCHTEALFATITTHPSSPDRSCNMYLVFKMWKENVSLFLMRNVSSLMLD